MVEGGVPWFGFRSLELSQHPAHSKPHRRTKTEAIRRLRQYQAAYVNW
jgi:hypothetical protein